MVRFDHRPADSVPELPDLDPGVTLLALPDRELVPLHSLVLDHLLCTGGTALWIDARNHGPSQVLARLAPSSRVLERVRIARGFTAFQHAAIVENAASHIDPDTTLVVAPAIDGPYRDEDVRGVEPRALLVRSLARLARYAREDDLTVLLTRTAADHLGVPVATTAQSVLEVEQTRLGPRFVGPDFETLVYRDVGPGHDQTTLAFWKRILVARQPRYDTAAPSAGSPSALEVTARGPD
ncbi:MAG: hypothetical protein ABEJ58_09515 [Halodesulfurarchaeum sp.]